LGKNSFSDSVIKDRSFPDLKERAILDLVRRAEKRKHYHG
jgi:hypothetical protein